MIRVRIAEAALQKLNDGFVSYEARQAGFGDYFATCLRVDFEGLRVCAGIHRVLNRVFPYGHFYTLEGDSAARGARSWMRTVGRQRSGRGHSDRRTLAIMGNVA